jgi:hypothetical protein
VTEGILFAALLIGSFGLCVWIDYRLRSPSILFWTGMIAFFMVPNVYDLLVGHDAWSGATITAATSLAIGFNLTYALVRLATLRITGRYDLFERFDSGLSRDLDGFDVMLVGAFLAGCALWLFGLQFFAGGLVGATWEAMLRVPIWISLPATALTSVAGGCLTVLLVRGRYRGALAVGGLFLFIILAVKARNLLAPFFLPVALYGFLRSKGWRPKVMSAMLVVLFAMSVFGLQILRWVGGSDGLAAVGDLRHVRAVTEGYFEQGLAIGEFGRRETFYYFVDERNTFPGFGEGRTYTRLLLMPVPTPIANLFGDIKPRDFAMDMWNASRGDYRELGGTDHPTMYGDAYANFGMAGFLIGGFWAVLFLLVDLLLLRLPVSVFVASLAPLAGFYALLARGAVYNGAVILYYAAAILGAVWLIGGALDRHRWLHRSRGAAGEGALEHAR